MILTLIAVGLILLLVEIYFTPGSSIFGVLGLIAIVWANVLAFKTMPVAVGWTIFLVSLIITVLFIILLIRMLSSKNFVVETEIKDKVNVIDEENFQIGEQGVTITTLRPNGRAMFNDEIYEVYSHGNYIEVDKNIAISKITSDKIFVKPV